MLQMKSQTTRERHLPVGCSLQPVCGTCEALLWCFCQHSPDILEKSEMFWVPFWAVDTQSSQIWRRSLFYVKRIILSSALIRYSSPGPLALSALSHISFSCIYLWGSSSDPHCTLRLTLLPGSEDSLSFSFGSQCKGQRDEALWRSGTHSIGTGAQLSGCSFGSGLKGLVCRLTVTVTWWLLVFYTSFGLSHE